MRYLVEMERLGTTDGFDGLSDKHKLAVLIAHGLVEYAGHLRVRFEVDGDTLLLWFDNDHSYQEHMAALLEMLQLAGVHYMVSKSYAKATDVSGRTIKIKR
jgi:hypothetical protein